MYMVKVRLLCHRWVSPRYSHVVEGMRKLSGILFLRAQIRYLRFLKYDLINSQRAQLQIYHIED